MNTKNVSNFNKKDKIIVNIKEHTFSFSKESGRITSYATIEIRDVSYDENGKIKKITRHNKNVNGSGFTFDEAYLVMLSNIGLKLKGYNESKKL